MSKPPLAFAMSRAKTLHVFEPDSMARLAAVCDILDPHPIEDFGTVYARDLIARAEILVTGWGCPIITPDVVAGAPNLRLIAHAAGTVKYTVSPAAYAAGIAVTQAADANAIPVAEFTLAAILFANKRVFDLRRLYACDHTRASAHRLMDGPIGNFDKTVGLVGASRIGRRMVDLLQPFDLRILLHDPHVGPGDPVARHCRLVDLDTLMTRSDVVSLHAPSLPTTRHMIGAHHLQLMPDGATFINTARGALVDEAALLAELKTGRIQAIIDVTDPEIPTEGSPLFTLPNVFLTPHIAGAAGSERARLGRLAVEEVERFVSGRPMRHAVEPALLEIQA